MWVESIRRVKIFLTGMSVKILVDMPSVRWSWTLPHRITGRQALENVSNTRTGLAFGCHPLVCDFFKVKRRGIDLCVMTLLGHVCGIGIRARTQSHNDAVGGHSGGRGAEDLKLECRQASSWCTYVRANAIKKMKEQK
jgi:hypothetical protein